MTTLLSVQSSLPMLSPSVGDLLYALGFTTTQTTCSSHLCTSPEVICLDSSLSSLTQLFQSLVHFLPGPPFPKHSVPSSSCILCLGTTTCPTNQVRNLGVMLDFPKIDPVSLEVFSSIALNASFFSLLLLPVSRSVRRSPLSC